MTVPVGDLPVSSPDGGSGAGCTPSFYESRHSACLSL